jgi:hypothetical protein
LRSAKGIIKDLSRKVQREYDLRKQQVRMSRENQNLKSGF